MPIGETNDNCVCVHKTGPDQEGQCISDGGIWVGSNGCDTADPAKDCSQYCTSGGKCVPEMSTIALLATGLIGMVGYLRLRRKEE